MLSYFANTQEVSLVNFLVSFVNGLFKWKIADHIKKQGKLLQCIAKFYFLCVLCVYQHKMVSEAFELCKRYFSIVIFK